MILCSFRHNNQLCKKVRLKYLILTGLLFMLSLFYSGQTCAQKYNFTNLSLDEGLAQQFVYTICQDDNGYLWAGTGNGLSRYNGFRFENYTVADSLADNLITCSISDGGNLWFGHNVGLTLYNGKSFRKINRDDRFTHLTRDKAGNIWASSYDGKLFELKSDSGIVNTYSLGSQTAIYTFEFTGNNELLAGSSNGLLRIVIKPSEKLLKSDIIKEFPTDVKINSITGYDDGKRYFAASQSDGLYLLTSDDGKITFSRLTGGGINSIDRIQKIYYGKRSGLWICTFGHGLLRAHLTAGCDISSLDSFNSSSGLGTDNVRTVLEDRESNIWTGSFGNGLTCITTSTFSLTRFAKSEISNSVFAFSSDNSVIWAGTANGLVKTDSWSGRLIRFYSKKEGLPKDTVSALYIDEQKIIWVGTERSGIYRYDPPGERFIKVNIGEDALENSVTSIAGTEKDIWIGTKKGLCSIRDGQIEWHTINHGDLPHNSVNCIYVDSKKRVWVSTRSNVLIWIRDGKTTKVPLNNMSGSSSIGPVTEDNNSNIWAGSHGNGLFLIKNDSIVNLTTREGLASNFCYSLVCDKNNVLWVTHKNNLSKVRLRDFSVKPLSRLPSINENLQFYPAASVQDSAGRILFGTSSGIVIYNQKLESHEMVPPALGITSIRINDVEVEKKGRITLSPGDYRIRIDFIGISLKEPALVSYQYQLKGYDQLSDITKIPYVSYNHLSEGSYTFILNASSGDGTVTEKPVLLEIEILKPLWKRVWFFPVTITGLVTLAFLYIKRREHKFLIENKVLEEKVKERTSEIEWQKNEIQKQRDLIDKKNASITSSIKYASRIQKTVLPHPCYVDSLFPENFILNLPKDIVSGDFIWLTESKGKIIFAVADCTGHGVPGAFMSLLGITYLNEIVNSSVTLKSNEIVTELRKRIMTTLRQNRDSDSISDGMDLALCVFDKNEMRITYTGGMNDILYIRDGHLNIIKADRTSVSVQYNRLAEFTFKEINVQKGDIFYLYSDGYRDQFGGPGNKKFLTRRFHKLLIEIHEKQMSEQKEILQENLAFWMGDNDQTDDITILGIRF